MPLSDNDFPFDQDEEDRDKKEKKAKKIPSMRKNVKKAQKFVSRLSDMIEKSADSDKISEKVREFVKGTDETVVGMMDRE
jgi:hypothetical protein